MRIKGVLLVLCFIGLMVFQAKAEVVRVGLEPFPPLITEDGKGHSVDMLRAIEKMSDLKFDIKIMTYVQAKEGLKEGKLDLIGHTPQGKEAKDFYDYAQDLKWGIVTITDIFGLHKEDIAPDKYKALKMIGTPKGNKEVYHEIFGIPLQNFYEADMDTLLKMLENGKLNAYIFERASTMYTIKKLKLKNIQYRMLDDSIRASFAVRKDERGNKLRDKLDNYMQQANILKTLSGYYQFINLPMEGSVSPAK
jgi:polar amino acid transport system substrate-binding protein